jgi:hypothetical protein
VARRPVALLLVLLAAVLLVVGLPLAQAHRTTRPAAFGAHAANVLAHPVVRTALAREAVDAIADAVEDVQPGTREIARQAVAPRAARVVRSAAFRRAWRTTARRGLRQAVDERRRRVTFAVDDVETLTATATGPLPPQLATLLRSAGSVPIFSFRRSATTASRTAAVDRASALGVPLLLVAAAALVLAPLVSPARRATAGAAGLALLGAGVVVALGALLARTLALSGAGAGEDREIAAIVWDELLGPLPLQGAIVAAIGLVVALVAAAARRRPAGRPAYPLG